MKKKKGTTKYKFDYRRVILVSTMMICIIVAMASYWIFAYNHKYGNTDNKMISYKVSDYTYTDGDIVYLKNLDKVNNDFVLKQMEIINNNGIVSNSEKGIYRDILSIKNDYIINATNSYEDVLTLNIDLKSGDIIKNSDLIKMTDSDYKMISEKTFDKYVKLFDGHSDVVDIIDNKKYTASEFNSNREKYVIRIREKLDDIIKFYISDGDLYYCIRLKDIDSVTYIRNGNRMAMINEKIGKI